jgi:hypothetical protein
LILAKAVVDHAKIIPRGCGARVFRSELFRVLEGLQQEVLGASVSSLFHEVRGGIDYPVPTRFLDARQAEGASQNNYKYKPHDG